MKSHSSGRRSRRSRGGSHRRGDRRGRQQDTRAKAAPKPTFWQRLAAFFGGNGKTERKAASVSRNGTAQPRNVSAEPRPQRKPEPVEVSSPRLYVGNLSFDA